MKCISSALGTNYLKNMAQKQIESNPCGSNPRSQNTQNTTTATYDQHERRSHDDDDDAEDLFGRKPQKKTADAMQQLQHFLSLPVSECAAEILQWPELKDIFLELNTPMPSSAASERLFSAASQIFLPRRSRINDTNFQNQLICKVNSSFA